MDAISYSYADKAQKRIKKFIENPDSTSGVVTVPTTIAAGETITIPAGRMAVLPDLQIDGDLVVDGEVFIPNGTSLSKVVEKVTSTDNAIVRFDGTTGAVQDSGVIIDDNNNVGIGTSNPLAKLVISNGSDENVEFFTGLGSTLNGGGLQYIHRGATSTRPDLNYFLSGGGGSHKFFTNDIERMRIDANGNVGIGVTTSAWGGVKAIELSGTAVFASAGSSTNFSTNGYYNGSSWIYKNTGRAANYAQDTGAHTWYIAPSGTAGNPITWTNAMTLDTSGNLTVGGNSTMSVIIARYDASNYIYTQARNTADTTEVFINLIGGVKRSAILANGTFQSATNSYGSTSDAKLKENVVDTTPKLEKLMQVQVRNFNYIGQEDKQIGVIAQEIEQIFPSVVFETKDTKQVEVIKEREKTLEDGTVEIEKYTETETQETGEVTKNVKYSIIYMMMLKGMQEQQEIINDLKSRIEILEGAK